MFKVYDNVQEDVFTVYAVQKICGMTMFLFHTDEDGWFWEDSELYSPVKEQ